MDRFSGMQAILEQTNGNWSLLGTITGTGGTAVTSQTTAIPFVIPPGARLLLQSDVAVYVNATPATQGGAALTTTAANGLQLSPAPTLQPSPSGFCLKSWQSDLSCLAAGAFNVKVFRLT